MRDFVTNFITLRNSLRNAPLQVLQEVPARGKPGRPPKYCSAACRQKAYRKRCSNPHAVPLRLLRSDLFAIEDRDARMRAAVRVLNDMGYEVSLERVAANPKQTGRAKPGLVLVEPKEPNHE